MPAVGVLRKNACWIGFGYDNDDHRLEIAQKLGATQTINKSDGIAVAAVMKITHGLGVNVAIQAVGVSRHLMFTKVSSLREGILNMLECMESQCS